MGGTSFGRMSRVVTSNKENVKTKKNPFKKFKDLTENIGKAVTAGLIAAALTTPLYGQVYVGIEVNPNPKAVEKVKVRKYENIEETAKALAERVKRMGRVDSKAKEMALFLFHHPEVRKYLNGNIVKVMKEGAFTKNGVPYIPALRRWGVEEKVITGTNSWGFPKKNYKPIFEPSWYIDMVEETGRRGEMGLQLVFWLHPDEINKRTPIYESKKAFEWDARDDIKKIIRGTKIEIPILSNDWEWVRVSRTRIGPRGERYYTDAIPVKASNEGTIFAVQYVGRRNDGKLYRGTAIVAIGKEGKAKVWNVVTPMEGGKVIDRRVFAADNDIVVVEEVKGKDGKIEKVNVYVIDTESNKVAAQ